MFCFGWTSWRSPPRGLKRCFFCCLILVIYLMLRETFVANPEPRCFSVCFCSLYRTWICQTHPSTAQGTAYLEMNELFYVDQFLYCSQTTSAISAPHVCRGFETWVVAIFGQPRLFDVVSRFFELLGRSIVAGRVRIVPYHLFDGHLLLAMNHHGVDWCQYNPVYNFQKGSIKFHPCRCW